MGGAEGPVGLALGGYRPPLRSPTAFPAPLEEAKQKKEEPSHSR